jgi:hypothetical protein
MLRLYCGENRGEKYAPQFYSAISDKKNADHPITVIYGKYEAYH